MSDILGALVCLKHALTRPTVQERRVQNQVVQQVLSFRLRDDIFNKVVQTFVEPARGYGRGGGKCYSRAITGDPICAIVITNKEPWIVAITRSVKVEWPEFDTSPELIFNRLANFRNMCRGISSGRIDLTDVDKASRQQAQHRNPNEPRILRETEGRDFMALPVIGKNLISFKNGFRIQILNKEPSGIRPLRLECDTKYRKRVQEVFTADTLDKLWQVYSKVEQDPVLYDKYLKGEIVGEPVDHQHPLAIWHASLYEDDFSHCYATGGRVPGILPVNTNGQVYQRKTRLTIPPPPDGARLLYKSEMPLLSAPVLTQDKTHPRA